MKLIKTYEEFVNEDKIFEYDRFYSKYKEAIFKINKKPDFKNLIKNIVDSVDTYEFRKNLDLYGDALFAELVKIFDNSEEFLREGIIDTLNGLYKNFGNKAAKGMNDYNKKSVLSKVKTNKERTIAYYHMEEHENDFE